MLWTTCPFSSTGTRKKISEDEFYGLTSFTCSNGKTIPPLNKGQQSFVKSAKKDCPKIFPEKGDCDGYYIISNDEKKSIDNIYKNKKSEIRAKIGAAKGEQINHRVPRAAGGCPVGVGNLTKHSDLSPDCKTKDKTLSTYQSKRAAAMNECSANVNNK
jgi:hypothetical protein